MSDVGDDQRGLRADDLGVRAEQVREHLQRGMREADALLDDYQRLQNDNDKLRRALNGDDDSLSRLTSLTAERAKLLERVAFLERASDAHHVSMTDLEQELNEYASLYIAAVQLGATLEPIAAVQQIGQLLEQFVGVARFVLYLVKSGGAMVPVAQQGGDDGLAQIPALTSGPVVQAAHTGDVFMAPKPSTVSAQGHVAVVPLRSGPQVVAVLAIDALHAHKTSWAGADARLFNVLSVVGGVALTASAGLSRFHDAQALVGHMAESLASAGDDESAASQMKVDGH